MNPYQTAFDAILTDPRYLANLDWGEPRSGHPEGTVRAHIDELERNLELLRTRIDATEYWKLKLLIHTHDSFKAEAIAGVAIAHPNSHASLARAFLAEFCDDSDLHAMVQYHDEPYALWRQFTHKHTFNRDRLNALVNAIRDWDLFAGFLIIDGCTDGKGREPLQWMFSVLPETMACRFGELDIL